ncbi:MAG TPA: MBL fold metallo-hydrolase [Acidobacteriaceae bacterium]|jgi:glyoxylase-like metal-dependent hydrolase (beta-lactamase superfamily II)|nr:MBL fold metallo-hydrolase [Acidobacteriaceae bacterium]
MPSRRDFLLQSGMATAGAWLARDAQAQNVPAQNPQTASPAPPAAPGQQPLPSGQNVAPPNANPAVQPNPNLAQELRTAAANETIKTTKLTDTIFLLQGVGGNVVCQIGPDGKLVIDSQISTGTPKLIEALGKLDTHRLKLLINTHWHFDHTDGNAALHLAGAFIIAQDYTRIRLLKPQTMQTYDAQFPAAPDAGLPQQTFPESETLWVNNDEEDLIHTPDAHTDSDIFIHFVKGNVIHTGDLWFNGMYPLIDIGSGGTINGMIRGVDQVLSLADDRTKIVPGHGALGDKAALQTYREMLVTVADRVEKLKASGEAVEEVVAAKPTADLDPTWAKGAIQPNTFVALVYDSL